MPYNKNVLNACGLVKEIAIKGPFLVPFGLWSNCLDITSHLVRVELTLLHLSIQGQCFQVYDVCEFSEEPKRLFSK
jgi:hypothetical protein